MLKWRVHTRATSPPINGPKVWALFQGNLVQSTNQNILGSFGLRGMARWTYLLPPNARPATSNEKPAARRNQPIQSNAKNLSEMLRDASLTSRGGGLYLMKVKCKVKCNKLEGRGAAHEYQNSQKRNDENRAFQVKVPAPAFLCVKL